MDTNLRTYETICITKVDMPEDKFASLVERCKASVEKEGKGEWLYSDDWGKAKISYLIGKDSRGRWTYMRYRAKPEGVDELLRGLSINESVLRQITCRTEENGSDYESLRADMMKSISERGERPRDWKDDRPGRGPRRDYDYRSPRGEQDASDAGMDSMDSDDVVAKQ
jgi:small subunit ribosomal protein S6